jgi:aspartyl-tRNA(Asn)/glutamyl-tRNA(Gln) amidotransferase subunit A
MARTVADARLLFEAVAGPDRGDPYGQGQTLRMRRISDGEKPRIGFLLRCGNRLDPAVEAAAVIAGMRQVESLGITVEPIELDLVSMEPHFLVMLRSQLLTRLSAAARRSPEKLDPTLIVTMEAGRGYSATDLWEAQYARTDCFGKVQKILTAFDLIASPTLRRPLCRSGSTRWATS